MLCCARAVMVQLGFYAHMKLAMGAPRAGLAPSGPLLFAVAFMLVFSAVIALFKDIPDVKGDRQVRPAVLWFRPACWKRTLCFISQSLQPFLYLSSRSLLMSWTLAAM